MAKIIPIQEIHKLLYNVKTLDPEQRRVVEAELAQIRASGLARREFELMLRRLRAEYKISEIDRSALLEAFAPYFE